MKTVLITGANGQLGNSIRSRASQYPDFNFLFTDVDTLNICDKESVSNFVLRNKVEYILNCAAYTAVDKAEDDGDLCGRVNRDAVRYLGEAAHAVGAKMIHVSTDYVFDGTNCQPYVEDDATNPVSVYGTTKLEGERVLMEVCPESAIVRTSWLYSEYGGNFMKTMLRLGNEREELRVISDQVGSPTYAGDLAVAMLSMLACAEKGAFVPGIYHFSNEGVCSWYDFSRKILEIGGLSCRVMPIETKDYPTRAVRPHYSVLSKTKIKETYGMLIPHWEESLHICMNQV